MKNSTIGIVSKSEVMSFLLKCHRELPIPIKKSKIMKTLDLMSFIWFFLKKKYNNTPAMMKKTLDIVFQGWKKLPIIACSQ